MADEHFHQDHGTQDGHPADDRHPLDGHHSSDDRLPADDYPKEPQLRDLKITVFTFPKWVLLMLIRFYQATFSHAMPPNTCRFYPSCSHYGYQAIYKYGAIKGSLMAAWRVLRCNPFNPGGFDPVP